MARMRWVVTGLCVAGAAASLWSFNWFSGQLYPHASAGDLAYKPDDMPPRIDMASVQRNWPASLDDPADGNRLIAYHRDMRGKVSLPSTGAGTGGTAATPPADLGTLLASADPNAGKAKAQLCASCHDFSQGGPNRIGPNLWGVVARPVASHAGFAYSPAMKAHGGAWSYDKLFEFLASPGRDVPGTKMSFAGLRRPEDRAAVIRYLATLGNGAPPLPAPKSAN
ncbi:cytochrome c family protein [Sphingobium sp. LMA1-1-1.1]|uniref:c-type cytochrome n=1 Tax=Sphingobium sp. LMA1-1-1.1 TaxID=3135238 RepID=UPI003422BDFE